MSSHAKPVPCSTRRSSAAPSSTSFTKLDPRHQVRNPVMFVVQVGSVLTTAALLPGARRPRRGVRRVHPRGLALALVHRAVRQLRRGDGRGPRQGAGRRAAQGAPRHRRAEARADAASGTLRSQEGTHDLATSADLRKGDVVLVEAGEFIPATARSSTASPRSTRARSPARARRSSARAAATAAPSPAAPACSPTGSSCASPPIPGETFLDRMIAMVEGAKRQKTPNEIALNILLAGAHDHLPARDRDAAAVLALRRARGRPGRADHHDRARRRSSSA